LIVVLGQDTGGDKIRGVRFDNYLTVEVEMCQDWSGRECGLEAVANILLSWAPHKRDVLALLFLGEGREWGDDIGVPFDEAPVEVRDRYGGDR